MTTERDYERWGDGQRDSEEGCESQQQAGTGSQTDNDGALADMMASEDGRALLREIADRRAAYLASEAARIAASTIASDLAESAEWSEKSVEEYVATCDYQPGPGVLGQVEYDARQAEYGGALGRAMARMVELEAHIRHSEDCNARRALELAEQLEKEALDHVACIARCAALQARLDGLRLLAGLPPPKR